MDQDFNTLINVLIAEAAGEGAPGMAAVAHAIRNRAIARGQTMADVVRAPHQFEGYSNPGPAAIRAQRNPRVRAQAEAILNGVLTGTIPDPTGGADHFHAVNIAPGWARSMPRTATIGAHAFYRSGRGRPTAPVLPASAPVPSVAERDVVAVEPKPRGGGLTFRHEGQDRLNPAFADALRGAGANMGRDLYITSGYRGPKHPVEARKRVPGQHAHRTAADISIAGMSDDEKARLVTELRQRGVKRFGTYSGSPNILHVDTKDQLGDGSLWFMHDRHNANMGRAPAWARQAMANDGVFLPPTAPVPFGPAGAPAASPDAPSGPATPVLPAPIEPTPIEPAPVQVADADVRPAAPPLQPPRTIRDAPVANINIDEPAKTQVASTTPKPPAPAAPKQSPLLPPDVPQNGGGLGAALTAFARNVGRDNDAEEEARAEWQEAYLRSLGPSPMQIAATIPTDMPRLEGPPILPPLAPQVPQPPTADQILASLFGRPVQPIIG